MFDTALRPWIDPPLRRAGRVLAGWGVGADAVTLIGLALGLVGAGVIAVGGAGGVALLALLAGRLADGLDGAVARAVSGAASGDGRRSDFGGHLDIACDFAIYGAVPLAFALRTPENAVPAAFLLFCFYLNAASFLGFAIMAAKRGMSTARQGQKSLYYAAGLMEGAETIAFFALVCLVPGAFPPAAWIFGGLCLVTAFARMLLSRRVFGADTVP